MRLTHALVASTTMAVLLCGAVWADIANTRHNLSVSGPGPVRATSESEICIFCHTPHGASSSTTYLWNRRDSTASYTTYTSSTLHASVGQPTGASKLCLSCHDGTIALGEVLSRPTEIQLQGGIRFMPSGRARLGTNLRDDHPVSFVYNQTLAAANGELASPGALPGDVRLDRNGELQCTSCHDPHDDTNGKFLVRPNEFGALCTTCHIRTDWASSSHATSSATWDGSGTDPWPHTNYTTVAQNACENCHSPHAAGTTQRLLNYAAEEDNCLVCHNGNVASTDIEAELLKQYRHPVRSYTDVHDAAEDFSGFVNDHVECVDCHNPHRLDGSGASAPNAPGVLRGVSGINASGSPVAEVNFAYEVCFKCHADNNVLSGPDISRVDSSINTRLEFRTSNPSFHPVEGPGPNPDVPSLTNGYTENSVVYCTDCHGNNNLSGPAGPHGSTYPHILERNYATDDFVATSSTRYALCFKCHSQSVIVSGSSNYPLHSEHLSGSGGMMMGNATTSCSTCHDPHGVAGTPHLVNFDVSRVSGLSGGLPQFDDCGGAPASGRCYLSCHGRQHNGWGYGSCGGMGGGGGGGGMGG